MLFRQRFKPDFWATARVLLWPRRSWYRSFEYLRKRVVRLSASPHVIALGFACGAFASCTPFVGFHFLIAGAIAFVLGGNIIASAIGTSVGNPLTFPFIWATTFNVGSQIVPDSGPIAAPDHLSPAFFSQSLDTVLPIFGRMLIGSVPCGIVVGIVAYFVIRLVTRAYQKARRRRLRRTVAVALSGERAKDLEMGE
ncbi:MAG: DUF2062 domain-containing protein [Pseudomonadota bacterium]